MTTEELIEKLNRFHPWGFHAEYNIIVEPVVERLRSQRSQIEELQRELSEVRDELKTAWALVELEP